MAGKNLVKQGEQRREQMVEFIRHHLDEKGYSPTFIEIGRAVGISSPNAVRGHLVKLQEQGRIRMAPRTARSIQVLEEAK